MRSERQPIEKFLSCFAEKNAMEDIGHDFLRRDEEGRRGLLTELLEEFGLETSSIDTEILVQIPERQNFALFLQQAYHAVRQMRS
ncbi:MAG: hypothetical protein AAB875_00945 [Patescibacteria group bacterium]